MMGPTAASYISLAPITQLVRHNELASHSPTAVSDWQSRPNHANGMQLIHKFCPGHQFGMRPKGSREISVQSADNPGDCALPAFPPHQRYLHQKLGFVNPRRSSPVPEIEVSPRIFPQAERQN